MSGSLVVLLEAHENISISPSSRRVNRSDVRSLGNIAATL